MEKFTVTKPPRTYEGGLWRRGRGEHPYGIAPPCKKILVHHCTANNITIVINA
jgi:hypothetical protein